MKKYNNLFQIKYILLLVFIVSVIFVGCSAGDGGLSYWQNNNLPSSAQKVNVKGKILSPSYNAQSVRTALALPTLEGVRVFVESDPSVSSQTDVEGNFSCRLFPSVNKDLSPMSISRALHTDSVLRHSFSTEITKP